ncbi:MAG: hypothetical protein M3Q06_01630 [Bacteroidota bacterium]|nr:hypothetical protein [Bacteroidota bacterium]
MKKTLLKFTSSIYLLAFRKYSKASYWEIDLNELTILCNCSEKEAKIACLDFNAIILNQEQPVNSFEMIEADLSKLRYQFSS